MKRMEPGYRTSASLALLAGRAEALYGRLQSCTLCPRQCGVHRLEGEKGYCGVPAELVVSSVFAHCGEEAPLVGTGGSGTIFFAGCSLKCLFCQNHEISMDAQGIVFSPANMARAMVGLQERGCHNINFVTPTHYVPQIVRSVGLAIDMGLTVPLVYNCGGYESVEVLKLLDGIVDIYMPDIKFMDGELSKRYCNAPDYPERVTEAVIEMQRQVGDLVIDENGIACRGLLIRHLVMPSLLDDTRAVLRFVKESVSKDAFVNIMAQYHPCYRSHEFAELSRRISQAEFAAALQYARDIGLKRAYSH
jgi:putative pyruvate formate lyase activating enzyme